MKFITLLLLFCTTIHVAAQDDQGRVKVLMHTFLLELTKLQPYLNSDTQFSAPEGQKVVRSSVDRLIQKTQNPPTPLKDSPGFRITFGLLADHIAKTKEALDQGELEHARMRLNGTTALCASCHTQTPKISTHSPFYLFDEIAANATFDNATLLFSIRRYDEAMNQLNQLARQYPKTQITSDQLPDLYRRKLSYFARVRRDPGAGIQNLKEDLLNKKLPSDIQRNLYSWIEGFASWKTEKQNPDKMNTSQLIAFVAKKIPAQVSRKIAPADPALLSLLRYSGLLYERLSTEKDPALIQQLLYYVGQCERSLAPLNWYSLNEIYLKECIVRYPKRDFSKKCYEAYQQGMQERYWNRPLPEGVQESLKALREYL